MSNREQTPILPPAPDALDCFDLYVIAHGGADRPYVSTTAPSAERMEVAKENGWEVRALRIEMVRSERGRDYDRMVLTWDRRLV